MVYTQENRLIAIDTPLGTDVLLLTGFSGSEGLSVPFSFGLDLLSENNNILFEDIIGQNVTVSIVLADGGRRFFNGIISRFSQERGRGEEDNGGPGLAHYTASMVPWLWLLTMTSDSRIFQELSVPDIVEQIFTEKGFTDYRINLHGTYDRKVYCVLYRETDFNFISRLLEQEGIFYFFEHENGKHTMILADSPDEHKPCPNQESARYHQVSGGGTLEEDVITGLDKMQEIRVGKYTVNDFNFEIPATDLKAEVTSQYPLGPGEREVYDYPAEYSTRAEGNRLADLRIQEEEAKITNLTGTSTCRAFSSGYRYDLLEYYRDDMNDKSYVLVSVNHGAYEAVGGSGEGAGASYTNSFTCIPFDVPFRPPLTTPKPMIGGVQSAIVVGPSGEEIYTDEHGRVKVQFHWDREGQKNENSSCWIRVSQVSAGAGWGAIDVPRIGHEVIVDFLEGDPDRPIIIGRVYHGTNTPPYPLPAEKTKSTFKSYSSPGGEGFNEIRFEDKKGEEQLFIHAEKNQDVRVKEDSLEWIGLKRHLIINDEQLELVESNKHLTVKGDHNEKVDGTISIETSMDLQEKVGIKHAVDAGQEIHLKAGMNVVLEAGTSITLKAGGGFIVVGPAGVTISGTPVLINSGGSAGSGSGCSTATPSLPDEADNAEPGEAVQMEAAESTSAQAQTLANAAESGAPFCDT
jgi:type VI secretion system secreted protein VgrG